MPSHTALAPRWVPPAMRGDGERPAARPGLPPGRPAPAGGRARVEAAPAPRAHGRGVGGRAGRGGPAARGLWRRLRAACGGFPAVARAESLQVTPQRRTGTEPLVVNLPGHRNRDDGLVPQAPGRFARRVVRGGAGRQELPVRGVHATSAPQRDNFLCNCKTSSCATAKCLWLSPQTYRAHERSRESIELAYDSILQQKMKVRHKYGFKPPKTGRKGDLDGDRSVSAGHALCCC